MDRSYIEELLAQNDIADLLREYITLKPGGRGFMALCPFHNEKTPSFSVNTEHQYFHCFGCGAGGNAITFIEKYQNVGFLEAVGFLALRAGMKLPQEDDEVAKKRSEILRLNKTVAKFFHEYLLSEHGLAAQKYLLNRGIGRKSVTRFGMGYAPAGFYATQSHLYSAGYSEASLIEAGIIKKGSKGCYDIFRDRIMFPIIDLRGNVIAFGGRLISEGGPKYLNSSQTMVFSKGKGLFALNLAKKEPEKTYLLCEGYMDVVALHSAGFKTAVATLGTAITAEQAKLLSTYADKVVLCYDSDEAGQRATQKATTIFSSLQIEISILELDGAKDPDEYIRKFGKEKFQDLIFGSSNTIEFALKNAKKGISLDTDEGRARYIRLAIEIIRQMGDTITKREIYAGRIERETGVSKQNILAQIDAGIKNAQRKQKKLLYKDTHSPYGAGLTTTLNSKTLQIVSKEQRLVGAVLKNPNLFKTIDNRLDGYTFCEQSLGEAYNLIKTYYLQGNPVEYAVVANELTGTATRVISATLAALGEFTPDEKDVQMYINGLLEITSGVENIKDMNSSELSEYLMQLKEKKR